MSPDFLMVLENGALLFAAVLSPMDFAHIHKYNLVRSDRNKGSSLNSNNTRYPPNRTQNSASLSVATIEPLWNRTLEWTT